VIDAVPKLLEVVCRTTGMGFAAVARVTEDRWVACAVRDEIDFGLEPGGELDVVTTICDEIRDTGRAVIIDHVAEDEAFCGHPTPAMYGFQSYISVPITHDGVFFGTLCAIDPKPAKLKGTPVVPIFELFAELIGAHLAARGRLEKSQAALIDAQAAAELREQFIAVLGHDLRNPLASIDGAIRLIGKTELEPRAQSLLEMTRLSVRRMAGLIDNVLDLARGRLGGGFGIDRRLEPALGAELAHVVEELRMANPGRSIEAEIEIAIPVLVDPRRICQLVSNLLANAVTHGSDAAPIRVRAVAGAQRLEISVANAGEPIPEAARSRLFQPFARAGAKPYGQGLGLGLWIAAEIARGHGATLEVASDAAETRFTFCMPVEATAAQVSMTAVV
jgi:signal transduction histidine kinase